MIEYIKKYPIWCGIGWIALLGVLAWLFQSWPGGFWGWLGIAWGWLRETPNGYESASTTIRNLGLLVAAPFALWFAYWRARVADRQSKAAQEQVATSQRQAETAQRGLLNERYQKGAEMLGSGVLSVRLGGIYALARLAREHPEEYHVQIMRLFCAFVRNPTAEEKSREDSKEKRAKTERHVEGKRSHLFQSHPDVQVVMEALYEFREHSVPELRPDIQAIIEAIGDRNEEDIVFEKKEHFVLDLRGANLTGLCRLDANLSDAILWGANLSNAILLGVNLSNAQLWDANLSNAVLSDSNLFSGADLPLRANLSNSELWDANLSGTWILGANLSGSDLSRATGLVQDKLDKACADPDNPPELGDTLDAETGKPLIWRGRSLYDE